MNDVEVIEVRIMKRRRAIKKTLIRYRRLSLRAMLLRVVRVRHFIEESHARFWGFLLVAARTSGIVIQRRRSRCGRRPPAPTGLAGEVTRSTHRSAVWLH